MKMEQWVAETGARVVVIFEGRDAAGKGGAIKRITEHMNPRVTQHVALPKPTERADARSGTSSATWPSCPRPARSSCSTAVWYNRAGVEHVLGFCTPQEYYRFLRQCPIFERLLVEDGILLIKYWFSVSDEEQERRFRKRDRRSDAPLEARPRPTCTRGRSGSTTRARRTRCSSTPTSRRRRGTSSRPTTRSGPGSTASRTCSR